MFCTDCVFRVRVGSLTEITEVLGTGMEVTEVPGRYTDVFTCTRTRTRVLYKCTPVPGYSTSAYLYPGTLQVHTCNRVLYKCIPVPGYSTSAYLYPGTGTYRSSGHGSETLFTYSSCGYGYGSLTELAEVPGAGMEVLQYSQKLRVGMRMLYPYPSAVLVPGDFYKGIPVPRVLCHGRT